MLAKPQWQKARMHVLASMFASKAMIAGAETELATEISW